MKQKKSLISLNTATRVTGSEPHRNGHSHGTFFENFPDV